MPRTDLLIAKREIPKHSKPSGFLTLVQSQWTVHFLKGQHQCQNNTTNEQFQCMSTWEVTQIRMFFMDHPMILWHHQRFPMSCVLGLVVPLHRPVVCQCITKQNGVANESKTWTFVVLNAQQVSDLGTATTKTVCFLLKNAALFQNWGEFSSPLLMGSVLIPIDFFTNPLFNLAPGKISNELLCAWTDIKTNATMSFLKPKTQNPKISLSWGHQFLKHLLINKIHQKLFHHDWNWFWIDSECSGALCFSHWLPKQFHSNVISLSSEIVDGAVSFSHINIFSMEVSHHMARFVLKFCVTKKKDDGMDLRPTDTIGSLTAVYSEITNL